MRRVLVVLVLVGLLVMLLSVPALANKVNPSDGPPQAWGMLHKAGAHNPAFHPYGQQVQEVKATFPEGLTMGLVNSLKLFPPD